ncbi:MAG TPA: hypothetical protein GXX65_07810 [Methanosarcina sp.]|nr:hypothetical protein [Methanosarcina sp.]
MNETGLERGKITKYLSVLRELHIIERHVPVTENSPESSKRGFTSLKTIISNSGSALSLKIPNISSRAIR